MQAKEFNTVSCPAPQPKHDAEVIRKLEEELAIAQRRVAAAMVLLPPKAPTPEIAKTRHQEFCDAIAAQKSIERRIAAAKSLPHAIDVECAAPWTVGAPMPHIVADGVCPVLIYYAQDQDPYRGWSEARSVTAEDGSIVAENADEELFGVVQFERCRAYRVGPPSDETWSRHPLYHAGLNGYTIQSIENSPWLMELGYSDSALHHFAFWFHDETFECVAESFKVETHRESLSSILSRASKLLRS